MNITSEQLHKIMPNLSLDRAEQLIEDLNNAATEFAIDNIDKMAGWLANLAEESGQLTKAEESGKYSVEQMLKFWPNKFTRELAESVKGNREKIMNIAYSNILGNGSIASGDGFRFRGRSPIQLTGRANYRKYGNLLNIDLENNPDLALDWQIGFRLSGCYWKANNLNQLSDQRYTSAEVFGNTVVKRINSGKVGLKSRWNYYLRCLAVFGVK